MSEAVDDLTRPPDGRPHAGFGTGAEVWLLRHGEVDAPWRGKIYGGLDVPLSDAGRRDTREAGRRFGAMRFDRVVASTMQRARELGEEIAQRSGAPLELDEGLVEIERGRWKGLSVEELMRDHEDDVARLYADPWNWREHGGESDADVVARAWPVLERALREARERVALCCHYNVVRVLAARALGVRPVDSFRLRVDLSGSLLLLDGPSGWRLVSANRRGPA